MKLRKKRCKCGFVASATTMQSAGEAIIDHCVYTGTCVAREAKDV